MRLTKRLGFILLAAWLILTGIGALVPGLTGGVVGMILAILAIAAGVLILIDR
jgi:hypothetical protein